MDKNDSSAADAARRDWAQQPRIDQELWESYPDKPHAEYGIDPRDGMPKPTVPHSLKLAQAPDLLPETFVCMSDCSAFVRRDALGRITDRFEPEEVERAPNGRYYLKKRFIFLPIVSVEPLRPACKHYARQMTDVQDDSDFRFIARLCTLRKTDDGEYLSLRDSQVFACELRDPRDYEGSARALDLFDDAQVEANRKKQQQAEEASFDVDAALREDGSTE